MRSYKLPYNLPEPVDDGACDHLVGMNLPSVALEGSSGSWSTAPSRLRATVPHTQRSRPFSSATGREAWFSDGGDQR